MSKWRIFPSVLAWLLLVGTKALAADGSQPLGGPVAAATRGAWASVGGASLILVEADRLVVKEDGLVRAVMVLEVHGGVLTVRNMGVKEVWKVSRAAGNLAVTQAGQTALYSRLPVVPSALDLSPLSLGDRRPMPAARAQEIAEELVRRRDVDQVVRKDEARQGERKGVDESNRLYLVETLQDVGWIDSERFGVAAARAAAILARHTDDPCLLQAILPFVEKDMQGNAISGELYSVIFDNLRLTLGYKQRFGTQLDEDQAGPFVVPLENAAEVDEYRRALGLPPLKDYLALASEALFSGKPIRIRAE